VSEESDFSNNEPSNAAKCKEYRERNKQKRRREEQEYLAEYEKHKKLKAKYERQKKSIKRLKEYYLELLRRGDLTCPRAKKDKREEEINRGKEIKEMEAEEKRLIAEGEKKQKAEKEMRETWAKNWEESRQGRVDSWMTFKGKTPYGQQKAEKVKKVKKAKFSPIGFRPPKPKPEQRM